MTARGIIIGAPRSGSGKTSVTIGLLRALKRRGVAVRGAKSGPDYIDPAFHEAATGLPGVNLDSWAMHPALLDALVAGAAEQADIVVIESAMGLFDGIVSAEGRSGSAADLGRRYGLPVLLVLDVSGQSQTAAAVAKGFTVYDPAVRIAGVVLNRVGSERHRKLAGEAIEAIGLPVVGSVMRDPSMTLPERHLGLVQASEHADLDAHIERLADVMERSLDVGRIVGMAGMICDVTPPSVLSDISPSRGEIGPAARLSPITSGAGQARSVELRISPLEGEMSDRTEGGLKSAVSGFVSPTEATAISLPPPGQRIALAKDAAFTFLYPHLIAAWQLAGAEIVPFSPLAGEPPDETCDVCWLPGGYPELHAGKLAAARNFIDGMQRFAAKKPVHGECGGFMVLGESLVDADGTAHKMLGLLGHSTSFAKRKMNLGYRQATLLADCPIGKKGDVVRGHEFHYAQLVDAGPDEKLAEIADGQGVALGAFGGRRGLVSGTFFHAIAGVKG
ncbi:cobyrinate a,c-diamide synthase [Mesorhizobium sp. IMUNJ 23232]|uniref:cobyrinate a,c-diamide synthase n=1 Tax=Mesorhizobium sp. IMUNJ 23232 TaxID=3376064 RepID=UPI0037885C4F